MISETYMGSEVDLQDPFLELGEADCSHLSLALEFRHVVSIQPGPLRQRATDVTPWTATQRGTIASLARLGACTVAVTWRDRPSRIPAASTEEGRLGTTQSASRKT